MNDPKEWTRLGYKVVPVNSSGVPVFSGIYDERYSESDISHWKRLWPGANLAVVCGANDVVAFDVDVDDEYVATCLRRRIPNILGGIVLLRRRQGSPRFAVLCREGEGMAKIAAAYSNVYLADAFGNEQQQIEYKGYRRLITVSGYHRKDTNSAYTVKHIPYVSELAKVSYSAFLQIMEMIEDYARDDWRCVSEYRFVQKRTREKQKWAATTNLFQQENGLATATIRRKPLTEREIEDLLAEADGSLRDVWMNVGISLWNLNNGAREDYERWDEWSKQFEGYGGERDQKYNWSTFKHYPHMTFEVLEARIKSARKRWTDTGPEGEELDRFRPKRLSDDDEYKQMMNKYVLIADGSLVADMTKPRAESIRTVPQMREFLRSKKVFVEQRTGKGTMTKKAMPMFDFWLQDKDHIEAWGVDYVPGLGPLIPSTYFKGRQQIYYNKYCPPLTMMVEKHARLHEGLQLFFEHLAYLFPNGGDKWMLNWMAQLIQEPDRRIGRVSPFSISTHEGTGRGWLTELLIRLVGASNYATVKDITDVIRPSAKSGYLDGTVLLVVNEVYVKGRERYNLLSQLKTLLTDNVQEIDVKFGKHTYNQQIYTRVFFQSNYIDGLVIDEKDSRIQPFINTSPPKDREYYTRLYALLDSDLFVDSVYSELMEYPIDYSLLQYSIDTEDRRTVIRSTKNPTALAFYEFRQLVGSKPFTDEILDKFMVDYLQKIGVNGEPAMVNHKAFRFLRAEVDQKAVKIGRLFVKSFDSVSFESEQEAMEAVRKTAKAIDRFFESRERRTP